MGIEITLKNGNKVQVRLVEPSDYENVQTYIEQLATENICTMQYPGKPRPSEESFCESIKKSWLNVIVDKDRVVGIVSAHKRKDGHPWCGHTCSFGIHMLKEYQGQGMGRALMEYMENWAKDNGIIRIEAEVRETNIGAMTLYQKMGYKIEGRMEKRAFINGKWYDEYIIGKIISQNEPK